MCRSSFSRRAVLAGGAAAIAAGTLGVRSAAAADSLNALVWCDHTDASLLKPFEQANGVKVNTKEFDSTGAAIAILEQSQPGDWDVLVLDAVDIGGMAKKGYLAELTASDYPWDDIFPELHEPGLHKLDGKLYGVPEKFGYNTVAYNNKKVDPADMRKASVMWDPKYKGRIAVYDYYNPVIAMVAIALRIKPNTLSKEHLPAIRAKLLEMKKLAALVGDVPTVQNALVTGSADIIVGGGEFAVAGLMTENAALDWVLPDEGGVRWMQSLAVFKDSKKADLARKFVQYILSPDGQGRLATAPCYWAMPSNKKANLTEAQKKTLRWDEQPEFLSRSYHYLRPDETLDKALQDLWTEFLNA
ncbi:MAG: spermidine/putrescine transport system substrate-binding protein [Rhodospirillaceae bacterium]|jgi:spermidine/putrescine transport system substrate-binding protein|nr:spermidine/putrescine transport system substrate-binding protein [Rhodospirillaceae bacterium]